MEVISLAIDMESRLARLKQNLKDAGIDPRTIHRRVMQAIVPISSTQQKPKLELNSFYGNKDSSGVLLPGQKLLLQNDGFVAVGASFGIAKAAAATNLREARWLTYADLNVFTTTENAPAQSVFTSGELSVNIGTNPIMQPIGISYFETVPLTQAAALVVSAKPYDLEYYQALDEDFGFSGGQRNYVELDLSDCNLSAWPATGYACVRLIGYVIIDGADVVTANANAANVCIQAGR